MASVTSDNGNAGRQTTRYFYEDLRLHIAGRGMLGFGAVTAENVTLGTKETGSVTKWDESLWIPTESRTSSTVGGDTGTVVSKYTVAKKGNNYFAYVSRKDASDLDGNTVTTVCNYDVSKGVIVDETVENDGSNMYKRVAYAGYQNKAGVWLPTVVAMSQKHSDSDSPYTSVTVYSYDDRGNVLSSTVNYGTDMALTTTLTYDVYGNVLTSVATGSGVKAVAKRNDYDASGRFVVRSRTSPASAVNTFTYDLWGNVLTESDATEPSNILTAQYTYDGWGRRLTARQADGTLTAYELGWATDRGAKYYTKETATGKPPVTVWFDRGGRELLQETFGPDGMPVSKATAYNGKGQVASVESKTGKLAVTQRFGYDGRGRVVSDVQSTGKSVAYSYGNRTVATTTAGRTYTKTYDAWGNIVRSTDPVGEVVYRYSSVGKPSCVMTTGSTVAMTYDAAGNQLSLSDPDAGTSSYTYAADGTLLTQTDGRGVKTVNTYDNLGRLSSVRVGQETIDYTYGTAGNEKLRLVKQSSGGNTVEYSHDRFGRVTAEKRSVGGYGTYAFQYAYDGNGQLAKTVYPGGLEVAYRYDDNGFKMQTAIGDRIIYRLEHADGLESSASFMGRLVSRQLRDSCGYESCRQVACGSRILESLSMTYDKATGNLLSRQKDAYQMDRLGYLPERFGYDSLDRLVSVKTGAVKTAEVRYAPNGNILFKTGVGDISYGDDMRPHAVTEVENANGAIPGDALNTVFNDFGKIQMIEDEGKGLRMDFTYGPDRERWSSELSRNCTTMGMTVYAGDYERVMGNGAVRDFYYLDGNTIAVRENGELKIYLAFTDNLGSILSVIDEDGNKMFSASYDAWGKQTVLYNKIGLRRGYTCHEMLSEFDIINMNGRLYDPVLGRFFSPDNYVQMPDNSQNFNRYSYCLNNPLKYTDPSGNIFGIDDAIIALAAFNAVSSMMRAALDGKNVWKAGGLSLLSSAASYGIGCGFKEVGTWGHEMLRAGAHGLASGIISALGGGSILRSFISGAAASGMGSYAQSANIGQGPMVASTALMGGMVALVTGDDFLQGAMRGMTIGIFNHAMHDSNNVIAYSHDKKGNIRGKISEVVVKPSRYTSCVLIDVAANLNTFIDGAGASMKENGGNSTFGSNYRLYWHTANERGFYGNQYVRTVRVTNIGKCIAKATGPMGIAFDVTNISMATYHDYQNYQVYGYYSQK